MAISCEGRRADRSLEHASKEKNLAAAGIIFFFSYPIPTSHKLNTERNVSAPKRRVARRPEEASREKNPAAAGIE